MEHRRCGRSELELSVLGLGCWEFGGGDYWGEHSQKDAVEVVHRAVDLGITYFDTAEVYNEGRSEASLGAALRGIPRDKVVIGTKVAPSNAEPQALAAHCDASLRRLETDYIDLYMLHWPIHPQAIRHFTADERLISHPPSSDSAFETLGRLRQQGKIRHIGVSNFGADRLRQVQQFGLPIVVNELPYSLLARAIEFAILPYCRQTGTGVIGYMALLQGLLADVYPTLAAVPPQQRRTRHFDSAGSALARHGGPGAEAETAQALTDIRTVAREAGLTMSQLAIKWTLANPDVTCTLAGSGKVRHLEDNVKAAAEPLSPEIVARLNSVTRPLMARLGPSFDYYESPENDRT
jgi:myo-inositol catabolism protein IolS